MIIPHACQYDFSKRIQITNGEDMEKREPSNTLGNIN